MGDLVTVKGGCHCKSVRWSAQIPSQATVWDCNCSICLMKNNKHIIVPDSLFTILSGSDKLKCYKFNTMKAQHLFCNICGVQSFYKPRSNPDGVGINPVCIDTDCLHTLSLSYSKFDGQNWEKHIKTSTITKLSKL
eukprot:TRINITY_DN3188_c0_g1_i2.p1 TRINITY_DN3188_c0_g1~~TRINITY_DN3188_c0_g1_i2.p1  ORF type:complete len:136 (+),score=20.87 TRINITY_DN3188_c0_g1_i2:140-547(+)